MKSQESSARALTSGAATSSLVIYTTKELEFSKSEGNDGNNNHRNSNYDGRRVPELSQKSLVLQAWLLNVWNLRALLLAQGESSERVMVKWGADKVDWDELRHSAWWINSTLTINKHQSCSSISQASWTICVCISHKANLATLVILEQVGFGELRPRETEKLECQTKVGKHVAHSKKDSFDAGNDSFASCQDRSHVWIEVVYLGSYCLQNFLYLSRARKLQPLLCWVMVGQPKKSLKMAEIQQIFENIHSLGSFWILCLHCIIKLAILNPMTCHWQSKNSQDILGLDAN